MSITPCKDCTGRHESCHSDCEEYKKWKDELDKERERIAEIRRNEADAIRRRNDAIRKRQRQYKS